MSRQSRTSRPQKVAVLGTGARAGTFIDALIDSQVNADLAALGDTNPGRLAYYQARVSAAGLDRVPEFHPDDLEAALSVTGAELLLVTTPDATHAEYIERAVRAGVDVIVEKPLATTAEQTRRIARAAEETGRTVRLAFNYRYSPRNTEIKRLLQSGTIGRVTSVHFEWLLDVSHGADYFRRWHREKRNSGGLLVHKSSHHFDLVNWWLDDRPTRVYASGGLRFYGEQNAAAADSELRAQFALASDATIDALYTSNARHDGYTRDADVFGSGITIEDNLGLVVDYGTRTTLTYSLNAHGPFEGYSVVFNGTEGRLELDVVERSAVLLDSSGQTVIDPSYIRRESAHDPVRPRADTLRVQRHRERARVVELPEPDGSHGGADPLLLLDLFSGSVRDPELRRVSSHVDGIAAVAVGIGGNLSLERGLPVDLDSLDFGIPFAGREGGHE